jgi:hypothetical protein
MMEWWEGGLHSGKFMGAGIALKPESVRLKGGVPGQWELSEVLNNKQLRPW